MTTSNPDFIVKILEETNKYRVSQGLQPLKANLELNATAQAYSEDMANQDYFNHGGKNGTSPISDLARSFGYEANLILDNIAIGNGDPVQVVNDWIKSPLHKVQLDNPDYTELGAGYAYLENDTGVVTFGHYWTQVFGTGDTNPATTLPAPVPPAPVPPAPVPPIPELPIPTKGNFQKMLDELGAFESGKPKGDPMQYQSENQLGFMGKYQFGEPLLIDLGYYKADSTPSTNDWQDTSWTGKGDVNSKTAFLNAPQVQETAIRAAFALNLERIKAALAKEGKTVEDYLGQVIRPEGTPIKVSLSGLLAGAHLRGPGGVAELLLRGVVSKDENGTPITQYVNTYGNYEVTPADLAAAPPVVAPPIVEPPVPPIGAPPTGPELPAPPVVSPPAIEQKPEPIAQTPPMPVVTQPMTGTDADDDLVSLIDQGSPILGLGGNDRIRGGAGNDALDGGLGNDQMTGGLGDDTYTVDSSTDVVIEAINEGNDTVFASASYTLSSNVENLILTGDNAINGTGNGLNNVMTGNAANNYLYGGDGNDQIDSLAGDDYLYGQAGNDVLNGGEGEDWLVGDLGDDMLSGGAGNDRVLGGAGNDTLSGEQGRNRLTGGADADRFVLDTLDRNFDIISDFKAAQGDKIVVAVKGMGGQMKRGKLSADQFSLGSSAQHDQAGFVYNAASGSLFFDADGMGRQKQVQIGKLTAKTALSSSNITVLNG